MAKTLPVESPLRMEKRKYPSSEYGLVEDYHADP